MPTFHAWQHPDDLMNGTPWAGDAGALVSWARWAVDSLYYLADLDRQTFPVEGVLTNRPETHDWHVIDLAHARWAAATAITATDLCAAALARRLGHGPITRKSGQVHEIDLAEIVKLVGKSKVSGAAAKWALGVESDPRHRLLMSLRHPTTHARLSRKFFRGSGGSERTHLDVGDGSPAREAGDIVLTARETAGWAVDMLLNDVAAGRF